MATFQKRIVDKWLADKIEEELDELRNGGLNGAGTIAATLAHRVSLHPNDIERVIKQFERELKRLRRSANLPDKWHDVRDALETPRP
jgi:hypothetical protein